MKTLKKRKVHHEYDSLRICKYTLSHMSILDLYTHEMQLKLYIELIKKKKKIVH